MSLTASPDGEFSLVADSRFTKSYGALKSNQKVRAALADTLLALMVEPFAPKLHTHPAKRTDGLFSSYVGTTGYRLIWQRREFEKEIRLHHIGNHDEAYVRAEVLATPFTERRTRLPKWLNVSPRSDEFVGERFFAQWTDEHLFAEGFTADEAVQLRSVQTFDEFIDLADSFSVNTVDRVVDLCLEYGLHEGPARMPVHRSSLAAMAGVSHSESGLVAAGATGLGHTPGIGFAAAAVKALGVVAQARRRDRSVGEGVGTESAVPPVVIRVARPNPRMVRARNVMQIVAERTVNRYRE